MIPSYSSHFKWLICDLFRWSIESSIFSDLNKIWNNISHFYFTKNTFINFSSSALYHIPRRLTIQQKTIEERISNRAISWASLDLRSHRARDRDLTPSSSFRSSPAAAWIRLENTRKCVGCKNEKNNQNVPKYTEKL